MQSVGELNMLPIEVQVVINYCKGKYPILDELIEQSLAYALLTVTHTVTMCGLIRVDGLYYVRLIRPYVPYIGCNTVTLAQGEPANAYCMQCYYKETYPRYHLWCTGRIKFTPLEEATLLLQAIEEGD